jgi:hypothetical protein
MKNLTLHRYQMVRKWTELVQSVPAHCHKNTEKSRSYKKRMYLYRQGPKKDGDVRTSLYFVCFYLLFWQGDRRGREGVGWSLHVLCV